MLTSRSSTYWSDHVPAALMMLRFTPQRTLGLAPFVMVTGHVAVPPSHLVEMGVDMGVDDAPELDDHLEQRFLRLLEVLPRVRRKLGDVSGQPDLEQVYLFEPGHMVLRRTRSVGKIEPRRDGLYEVVAASGQMR